MSNTWNYRIGTYIFDYKERFPDNPKFHENEPERYFCVISAYYTDGVMDSYGLNTGNILDGLEKPEDIKFMAEKILEAYKEPIIDLDSFPGIWKKD